MAALTASPSVSHPSDVAATHPFSCNTCQVAFKGSSLQRTHMQSDWHRYNLKRRVASLPPLTAEVFAEKVLANKASAAATAAKASFERICSACQRTYFSENAYQNHLLSQKHRARVVQLERTQDSDGEDDASSMASSTISLGDATGSRASRGSLSTIASDISHVTNGLKNSSLKDGERQNKQEGGNDEATSPLQCLFCNHVSPSIDMNVTHMQSGHGMFIPEREFLVDLEGMLTWLSERVAVLHECLYCGQLKHTKYGIQTHMRDKGHCKIAFDAEEDMIEVGQFYDFRSTYSDEESEDDSDSETKQVQNGGVKLGGRRKAAYTDDAGEAMSEDDGDGWESDASDEAEEDDEDEEGADGDESLTEKVRKPLSRSRGAYVDDMELRLPSGRTAGHRSLAKYFRQNLRDYPSLEERGRSRQALLTAGEAEEDDQESGSGQTATSRTQRNPRQQALTRANGGLGMVGVSDQKKSEARTTEMREARRAQRVDNRYQWNLQRRANNQKHFRDPLLQ